MYQQCQYTKKASEIDQNHPDGPACAQFNRNNPFAAADGKPALSCPKGYERKTMNTFYLEFNDRMASKNTSTCNFFSKILVSYFHTCFKNFNRKTFKGCTGVTEYPIHDEIKVSTFYCTKPHDENAPKAMFGGIYENDNVFAEEPGCSVGFTEYPFLHNLKICMTSFKETLKKKNIAFGGLINCRSQNKECGNTFSRYLATTIDNCGYYYCAQIIDGEGVTTLPKLSRPPYTNKDDAMSKTRAKFQERMDELNTKAEENRSKKRNRTTHKGRAAKKLNATP